MAAALVIPANARRIHGVRDSKMLTFEQREKLFDRLTGWCTAWCVGHASQQECDELGMSAAQKLAARRAIDGLGLGEPSAVLVDGSWDFVGGGRTARVRRIIRGDAGCLSIATASIIAKVTRDRLMQQEAEHFPAYDFDKNKGYPCPRHKAALAAFGPTSIHRRAWIFMEHMVWGGVRRYSRQPDLWEQQ